MIRLKVAKVDYSSAKMQRNGAVMKLLLDINLEILPADTAAEVGRILRYWAGAVAQMDLDAPAEFPLMDSTYKTQVGTLRLELEDS